MSSCQVGPYESEDPSERRKRLGSRRTPRRERKLELVENSQAQSPAMLAGVIEGEIIPRLMLAHRAAAAAKSAPCSALPPFDVEAFCELAVGPDHHAVMDAVQAWQDRGAALETLLLDLLAPAARRLGDLWSQDLCSFADVTVGLMRLQQAVHELSMAQPLRRTSGPPEVPTALFATAPGEQHMLGISMVAELFRQAGWRVWGEPDGAPESLAALVSQESFDLLGLTLSRASGLDDLQELISSLRTRSLNPNLKMLVGGHVFVEQPELAARIGADATASDARAAVTLANTMMARSSRKL